MLDGGSNGPAKAWPDNSYSTASTSGCADAQAVSPSRLVEGNATNFRLETEDCGVFTIHARIDLKSGGSVKLKHSLDLHYPDGTVTVA
jgi:hypothetical protein